MRDSRVLFITGAGLSAESGIKTYRGSGGYYENKRAEDITSASMFKTNPETLYRFCDDFRESLKGKVPNAAHEMIGRVLRDYEGRATHCTQNIDGLSPEGTIELHGRLSRMRSIGNSKVLSDIGYSRYWDGPPESAPEQGFRFRCPKSGSLFRPDVILFGELAPNYAKLFKALNRLRSNDFLVVIGTEGSVIPVESLARSTRARTILNNLHPSESIDASAFDMIFMDSATNAAPRIEEVLRNEMHLDANRVEARV